MWVVFGNLQVAPMDQIKLLRVRAFHNFLEKNPKSGLYLQLGQYDSLMKNKFDLKMLKNIKTSLFSLSSKEYDELVNYGVEITNVGLDKWYNN